MSLFAPHQIVGAALRGRPFVFLKVTQTKGVATEGHPYKMSNRSAMDVPATEQSIEAIILQIEQQVFTAIQQKDTGTLAGILAEDFVHRSPDGSGINREQFLKNITAVPVTIVSIGGEHQKVNVYGDVAVLTGVQRAAWKQGETEKGVSSGAFTDVFVRRGDQWLMVLAYSVDLPD